MNWRHDAACVPERTGLTQRQLTVLFFGPVDEPETHTARRVRREHAASICAACPVADDCLNFALANHITDGIWGGVDRGMQSKPARKVAVTKRCRWCLAAFTTFDRLQEFDDDQCRRRWRTERQRRNRMGAA